MAEWLKYPEENLDYAFDFTDRLEQGETIASFEVTVPEGLVKGETSEAQGVVTVWIDGGTSGRYYMLECQAVSSAGRELTAKVEMYIW